MDAVVDDRYDEVASILGLSVLDVCADTGVVNVNTSKGWLTHLCVTECVVYRLRLPTVREHTDAICQVTVE